MKTMFLLTVTAAILFGVGTIQAKDGDMPIEKEKIKVVKQLTDADNGRTVKIAVGESFDIAVKGNATTGYMWKLEKIDGDAVAQKGEMEYVTDKHRRRMAGVGGTSIFHFEVKKAAKTKIELGYARPWEKDKKSEKTFTVTIDSEK